ncbi:porin [Shewanella corallii]|uniref:Porin n=1 Tax=Shewanella corallii TaxID=560080 RepID=A0ABT0NBR3_9GAMM|nr:porin [Shewanella corallii]MCL2915797.1 porin [Shewanella corallii]
MNKTLIAAALAAITAAPAASAVELYKDANNEVTMGGYADARILSTDGETELVNGASRINFNFSHKLSNGWNAFAKMEWGVNPFGDTSLVYNNDSKFSASTGDFISNRLGYVGLSNDKYGSFSFGKQWSAYYDVVVGTDNGLVWGGSASGAYSLDGSGGIDGAGRADKAVQYRNSFGNFSFALQAQLQSNQIALDNSSTLDSLEYNDTYGASVSYKLMDKLVLSAGGNVGEFQGTLKNGSTISETDSIYAVSATWGALSDGLYASVNYNKNEYHELDKNGFLIPSAYGVEAFVSYNLGNGFRPYAYYNLLDADDAYTPVAGQTVTENTMQYAAAGVEFKWDSNIMMYVEGKADFSKYVQGGVKSEGDNAIAVGVRYSF